MNKTKEETLSEVSDEIDDSFQLVNGMDYFNGRCTTVFNAMTQYAKQECIEFRRFCQAEYKQIMVGLLDNLDKDFDTLAYELYLQYKTK